MKSQIEALINTALSQLAAQGEIALPETTRWTVERTRDKAHGDFASNAAMVLAKPNGKNPRDLAQKIMALTTQSSLVSKVELAGPGFINFTLKEGAQFEVVKTILSAPESFGRCNIGQNEKILIEYVSANPTGPMHVGHGRGAAYGSALANMMRAAGYDIKTEYYINDAGRQADVLAVSVYLRYLEALGETIKIPSRAYPADYVKVCAQNVVAKYGTQFKKSYADVLAGLPADPDGDGDEIKMLRERHLDALIERVKSLLADQYATILRAALDEQLASIRATLEAFSVEFDSWFSEASLVVSGEVAKALNILAAKDRTYTKDGALWLKTSDMGDEKDRVLIKDDGAYTYLMPDIAYHLDKLDRGFDRLIDVWGADHHGYIARMRAAIETMSGKGDHFEVSLIQFVTLSSGRMGKRSGNFVTLKDLIDETGADATRFFYLSRSQEQHLEFDIDLARSQTNDNPVYYVQMAHARICRVLETAKEKGFAYERAEGLKNLTQLGEEHETALASLLERYPEYIATCARNREPHLMTHYLRDVAAALHSYYNAHAFLVDDAAQRNARLALCEATRVVLKDGLRLLGIGAPESM